jgi:hypothetical protein
MAAVIHRAILTSFALSPDRYTLTQLRCGLGKMKAHGLRRRIASSYRNRLSDKGAKAALLFMLFHKRVSAGHWQTRGFSIGPTKLSSRPPARSKLHTTRPIVPSNTSSTCLLHEDYAR